MARTAHARRRRHRAAARAPAARSPSFARRCQRASPGLGDARRNVLRRSHRQRRHATSRQPAPRRGCPVRRVVDIPRRRVRARECRPGVAARSPPRPAASARGAARGDSCAPDWNPRHLSRRSCGHLTGSSDAPGPPCARSRGLPMILTGELLIRSPDEGSSCADKSDKASGPRATSNCCFG